MIDYQARAARLKACGCEHKASDPYGVLTPTLLPGGGRSGEPIPRPGLPDTYPHYLRPIPVNTRNIRNILDSYINTQEPKMVEWLYSTWTAAVDPIKYQELRNAIRTGELSQSLIDAWRQDYAAMINDRLIPEWEAAARVSHGQLSPGIIRATGSSIPYEATAARLSDWIRIRSGELIVGMTQAQTQAIRGVLQHYLVEDQIGSRALGRLIRPMVGLTPGQSAAVIKYREQLVAQGLSPDKIINQVENYSAYLHRIRAQRIAQTEVAFAFNQAALETMREARDLGVGHVTKTSLTGRDEKVCDLCGSLEGVTIELEETFPGATARLPSVFAPPYHPNCRCTILYGITP